MNKSTFIVALLKCKGIGNKKALNYIIGNKFLFTSCVENLNQLVNINEFNLHYKEAKKEINSNLKNNISIVSIFDSLFPSKLYTITDPVLYLYYRGNIQLLSTKSVAVIGTRHPTDLSIESTKNITKLLAKNYTIIGGLALGIDKIGHETAIEEKGYTIAVLPSSIDKILPSSNQKLANKIVENGGLLLSEDSIGTEVFKFNYVKRDRIQSALSNLILIPEAKENSGTMITVKNALMEGKKVYQLTTNINNNSITNSVTVDDDIISIFDKDITKDIENEISKKNKLYNYRDTVKQISIFE